MKHLFTVLFALWSTVVLLAQNLNYESRITRFYGDDCGNDPGIRTREEHTWYGFIRDNLSPTETGSGCVTHDDNAPSAITGTWATRNRTNTTATVLYGRIDAWEDDRGNRCAFDTDNNFLTNDDDCRNQATCTYFLTGASEYLWNTNSRVCGGNNYNMTVYYRYRYHTISLNAATENTTETFTGGGTRPFWGSVGNWSNIGGDCAASGTIGHNETSSFSTTVTCKSQVRFRWRGSSQANGDYLEIWVNGVRRDRISGNTNWTTRAINLDFGTNVVEWRYDKNGNTVAGLDRGFIDNIEFIDATSLQPGGITGDQDICAGGNPGLLSSTSVARSYSPAAINYQWQRSINNLTWSNISGATGLTYDPPANATQRYYYRRRATDGCGVVGYTNTIQVNINALPNGNLANTGAICPGNNTNLIFNATAGTGPFNVTYTGGTSTGLSSGGTIAVSPSTTTNYQLFFISDANGCTRNTGLGSSTTVNVNTNSTAPTIASVSNVLCPNTALTLSASGGTAGTGSAVRWYSGPNGSGTALGVGNSITVSPSASSRYYARREGTCNTTNDDDEEVTVRNFAYTPVGVTTAVDYCTDDQGWHHFYTATDDIIFSMRGDLSGAAIDPIVSVTNNGSFYQATLGAVGACVNGWSPGEEQFELPRSWNVNFTGTLNPPYDVRYYFPASEKTTLENAANAFMAANPTCGYTYKYPFPNGFYWFKNLGAAYVPPLFDQPTKLTGASSGSINGINYSELPGVTSFSGGSGGIILSPDPALPVELSQFTAWNAGAKNTLQWVTQSELNNDRFEVERSADGHSFERIGTVKGAGTSVVPLTYFWNDETPLIGVNYYRLRQVDDDGTTSFSNVVAVLVEGKMGEARFFPNPVQGSLTYQFNAQQNKQLTLRMTDVLGRVLQDWTYNTQIGINTEVLDLSAFAAGTYSITVYNEQGEVLHTERIVKQ